MFRLLRWFVILLGFPILAGLESNTTCLIKSDAELANQKTFQTGIEASWVAIGVVNAIVAIPTAVINWLIIWTILIDKRLRASNYNTLLSAMALTDLLTAVFIQPLFAWYQVCLPYNCAFSCQYTVLAFSVLSTGCVTLSTLSIASIERYLAIEHPLYHRTHITRGVVVTAMIIAWLTVTPTMITSRALLSTTEATRKIPPFVVTAVNVAVILYCNAKVNITAHRKKKAIAAQRQPEENTEAHQEMQRKLEEYRKGISMGLMVLGSIACYIPSILLTVVEVSGVADHSEYFKMLLQPISITCVFLQSLVNPIIVSLRSQCIREGIKNKLKLS